MKKLLAVLLCALLFAAPALADTGFSLFPTPAPAEEELPSHDDELPEEPSVESPGPADNFLNLTMRGKSVELEFDPDPEYSLREGGFVQASFFSYDTEDSLYEVYLIFPENVQSGSIVNPASCLQSGDDESCVLLLVSTENSELYAAAGQMSGAAYPEGADYAIRFTDVSRNGTRFTYAGTVSATLIALDENYNPTETIDDFSASFRFTMDFSNVSPDTPQDEEAPYSPYVIPQAPAFLVTPPDAQKI